MKIENVKHADDIEKKTLPHDDSVGAADPFFRENNIRYLKGIKDDVENGTARFAEHVLIED